MEDKIKALIYEIRNEAMMDFEQICEEILIKNFISQEQNIIQTKLLDEAQRIFESSNIYKQELHQCKQN